MDDEPTSEEEALLDAADEADREYDEEHNSDRVAILPGDMTGEWDTIF